MENPLDEAIKLYTETEILKKQSYVDIDKKRKKFNSDISSLEQKLDIINTDIDNRKKSIGVFRRFTHYIKPDKELQKYESDKKNVKNQIEISKSGFEAYEQNKMTKIQIKEKQLDDTVRNLAFSYLSTNNEEYAKLKKDEEAIEKLYEPMKEYIELFRRTKDDLKILKIPEALRVSDRFGLYSNLSSLFTKLSEKTPKINNEIDIYGMYHQIHIPDPKLSIFLTKRPFEPFDPNTDTILYKIKMGLYVGSIAEVYLELKKMEPVAEFVWQTIRDEHDKNKSRLDEIVNNQKEIFYKEIKGKTKLLQES